MRIEEHLKNSKEIYTQTQFNPYYQKLETGLGERITVNGKEMINLASNNYLGLADDERVKQCVKDAIDRYGVSLCGTPIAVGYTELSRRLEERLAKFTGVEDAILLPSCYQANNGVFLALTCDEDIIIFDHYAHSSLVEGINAAKGTKKPFLHNDMRHLEKMLAKSMGFKRRFVVTESVFSTEGTIAPAGDISDLCVKYNATFIIDDSHGIGVIGKGRGILREEEIKKCDIIYTASLGKALANMGGMIGGDSKTIEYLRYTLSHLIYSTALPPMIMAGIEKSVEIVENEYSEISERMWRYKSLIGEALLKKGFKIVDSRTAINSIESGSMVDTILIAKKFYNLGMLVTPFVEPSVPKGHGKVRIIAGANLSNETITEVIRRIDEIPNNI